MIHIIRDRILAQKFNKRTVSERETCIYLLLFLLSEYASKSAIVFDWVYETVNHWDTAQDVTVLLFTLFGILLCYKTNKAGDNEHFVQRFMCIAFPVTIQMLAILIPIEFAFYASAEPVFGVEVPKDGSQFDLLFLTLGYIYYYWRLNGSIRVASRISSDGT